MACSTYVSVQIGDCAFENICVRTGCFHTQLHSVRAVMWLAKAENQSGVGCRNLIDMHGVFM